MQDQISEIARRLAGSRSVLFVTGAGISADSGLPTYRGIGGLYEQEETDEGIPIEAALSGAMFQRDPALTWKYIHQIESSCRDAGPNRAHEAIAELESLQTWLINLHMTRLRGKSGRELSDNMTLLAY